MMGIASLYPSYSLRLFYLFPQNLKLQPPVLSLGQFLLRLCDRGGGRVELLAILGVEVGIVKQLLLFGNLGLQLRHRLRQGFQRVLLVEVQPTLWRRRGGGRPGFLLFLDGSDTGSFPREILTTLRQHVGVAAG